MIDWLKIRVVEHSWESVSSSFGVLRHHTPSLHRIPHEYVGNWADDEHPTQKCLSGIWPLFPLDILSWAPLLVSIYTTTTLALRRYSLFITVKARNAWSIWSIRTALSLRSVNLSRDSCQKGWALLKKQLLRFAIESFDNRASFQLRHTWVSCPIPRDYRVEWLWANVPLFLKKLQESVSVIIGLNLSIYFYPLDYYPRSCLVTGFQPVP